VGFIDYYEVLEVSPNANSETIERVFRYLAKRYHPDNLATGNRDRFDLVLNAFDTLRDTVKRVQYDRDYDAHSSAASKLADEASDFEGADLDAEMQSKLLALFYCKRRRDTREPGLGDAELAILLKCPPERLDFHLWYLKEKKWIARREDGLLAITADGVDRANGRHPTRHAERLLTDQS